MPILKENRKLYPKNWKEISRHVINDIAHNRCMECDVPNHAVGYRDEFGYFHPTDGNRYHALAGKGLCQHGDFIGIISYSEAKELVELINECNWEHYIVIVLTVAHLDHNPANCDLSNLKALCQKCHNTYDAGHRANTRKYKGQLKLNFNGAH